MNEINSKNLTLKWWQSLRFNLITTLIAVSIIPIIALGVLLSEQFRARTIEQVTNQLQSVSTLKTSEIDTWLESTQAILGVIAENPILNAPIRNILETSVDEEQIEILSKSFERIIEQSEALNSLFVYDLDGHIQLSSSDADIGKIVSRQPYFQQSVEVGEYYVGLPYYDIRTQALTIIVTEPILNGRNEIIGIIASSLNIDTLSNIMLERSGLGDSGETYLVSHENNYFLTASRFEGYEKNRAYHSLGINQALDQFDGEGLYSNYRDVSTIGVYNWIPQLESAMLVEINEDEALSGFDQAILSTIQGTILLGVVVILIGIFLAQRISRPITQLAQTAEAIASGDLEKQVDVQGSNEIAILGNTFNQMTGQLASYIQVMDDNFQELDKTNRQLGVQSAMAREATRLKSEFLATMSHELRTPLNAITGFTGILLFDAEELGEDNAHMLQRVESNAKRLLTLIDDVLDLSKIEAGRVEIVDEPIQIRSLVDQWIGETSVLAENKNLPLYTDVSTTFPETIYGDSARLTQITNNLLSNAIKFTSEGSVSLQVTAIDSHWHIIVTDTGIGIPPHARNYIFDEFRQVDGTSRRVYGGTGLGLAITRNLVLMMNGTVTVDSEMGQGSTFTVRLPLRLVSLGEVEPMLIPN